MIAPAVASAQRTTPGSDERSRANLQRLFREATAAFDSFDNERALALFQRLYQLTEDPPVLVNIASVLVRLRRDQDAISAWQRFLETHPSAGERAAVEGSIREAQERVDRARTPVEPPAQTPIETPPPPRPTRTVEVTERVGPGPAPWVLLGVGAGVAASAAIPFFVVRGGAIGELQRMGCDPFTATVCDASLRGAYERAQSASAASIALVSVGGAAIVAGALWGALGGRTERRTITVSGWIDPARSGAGITLAMGAWR